MDTVEVNEIVGYWGNCRAKGQLGGWDHQHFRGLVVKVNPKTLHVKRQLGDCEFAAKVDVVPRYRAYAVYIAAVITGVLIGALTAVPVSLLLVAMQRGRG